MKGRSASKIKLTSYDELLGGGEETNDIQQVSLEHLHSFENHPFQVNDDEAMAELVESVKEEGILTALLVRPLGDGEYEIIAGHRRRHAAQLAGLKEVPVIIRNMDQDTAVRAMVDSNLQRPNILPSEKAFAYRMKMEAMNHQGTSGGISAKDIGKNANDSARQVYRYIRLTYLMNYFQGMECDMYSFYRIPKLLFTSEYFKNLSCEAKVLYGLMLDRMSLSIKNRWFDEEDRAYIFFSVEEIMEMLNCGRNKAVNCLKELDQEKGIGLIEKRRIGLGKTNVIYVKNFSLTEYPDEPAIFDSEETPENVAERKENTETEIEEYAKKEPEKPVNTQKFEKQTSGSLKNKLQEVLKTNFKEFEKQTSRSLENKLQEVSKTNCNNTEYNYTEFSENESYQYLSEQEKGRDRIQERNEYRQLIHDNIEYEILCQSYGTGRVEELVELMLDAICSTKTYQQINGEAVPTQVVKSRLLKVGYEHIQYVFFSLDRSTSKVKNIRQYMLTVLYNAPATINQFYDSNHSLPVDYAKSCPYLMSFMKKYKIKEQIEKYYIKHPDEFGSEREQSLLWLNRNKINKYDELPKTNARLSTFSCPRRSAISNGATPISTSILAWEWRRS